MPTTTHTPTSPIAPQVAANPAARRGLTPIRTTSPLTGTTQRPDGTNVSTSSTGNPNNPYYLSPSEMGQPRPAAPAAAPAAPRQYPSNYYVTPGYDMSIPGASEYLIPAIAPTLQAPGYSENYAQNHGSMYQSAQQNTATNQLLSAYGGQIAQPTAFENYAYSTPAPTGQLYGTIGANQQYVSGTSDLMNYARSASPQTGAIRSTMGAQAGLVSGPSQLTSFAQSGPQQGNGANAYYGSLGQVTGPNDVLEHGRNGQTDAGRGDSALLSSQHMVTDPTRIGSYMNDQNAYLRGVTGGVAYDSYARTGGMVQGNTLGGYADDPNAQYRQAGNSTAAQREMAAAGGDMASGVDTTTAAGRYWSQLQQDPTKLPDANLDAYYDRQRTKSQAELDRALAARGLFGSSYGVDATREMMLDLAAQQVKDESDYSLAAALARNDIAGSAARDADTSGLSRYVARNDAARGVDNATLGLGRLGLDARTANDQNTLARYIAQNDVAGGLDARGIDLYLGRGDLMNRSDLTDATRFSAYNQAANAVDQTDIDAYNSRTNALDAGGRLDVSRFAANNAAAQGLDQNNIAAYSAQADAMLGGGQLDIGRYNASINAANLADRLGLDEYTARGNMLRDAGQLDVDRFSALTGAVNNADRTALERYATQSDVLNNASSLGLDRYRTLVDSAVAADNSSRSLYTAGADVARMGDQSINDRIGSLMTGAGNADLSRVGRTNAALGAQQENTATLDAILSSGYGDMIQSDEQIMQLIASLGLGAGAQNLQGALGNQAATAASGAQLTATGAQADATARSIVGGVNQNRQNALNRQVRTG